MNDRQWLFLPTIFLASIIFILLGGELLVRVLVPKEFYLPISNIYQHITDEEIGYTYKPNYRGTAFGVPLYTNSLGFRGPDWKIDKHSGSLRIALIGDSHAFGYGVEYEDTVGEKLAILLNDKTGKPVEVLNFGVAGYNSRQELAVLKKYALKFKPDIIIAIPCSNDHEEPLVADNEGYLHTGTKKIADKSIDRLSVQNAPWIVKNSRLAFYILFIRKQYLLSEETSTLNPGANQLPSAMGTWWMGKFEDGQVPATLSTNVGIPLREMIRQAKKRHIPIILANFNSLLEYRRLFAQLAREEAVPSIELLSLFPEANSWDELQKRFGLGWNNHLNAKAHARWAEALAVLVLKILHDNKQLIDSKEL